MMELYGREPLHVAEESFVEDATRHLKQSQKHRKLKVPVKALRLLHSVVTAKTY